MLCQKEGRQVQLVFGMISKIIALALICSPVFGGQSSQCGSTSGNLYEYSRMTLPDFGGKTVSFDAYKGHVVIAVNVATF